MLTPPLPPVHFFHFSNTCSLGSNWFYQIFGINVALDSFLESPDPTLVLECYAKGDHNDSSSTSFRNPNDIMNLCNVYVEKNKHQFQSKVSLR
jgi:hypothetical protein